MGGEVKTFTSEAVISAVTAAVRIDVVFADNGGDTPVSGTATFDFTVPEALNPAQTVSSSNNPVCEVDGVTFVSNGVTVTTTGGGTTARLWAYRDSYQYRVYNGATMVIRTTDSNAKITKIAFEGATLDALSIDGSALDNNTSATYQPATPRNSVQVKCVTNGSHKRADISKITVEYTSGDSGVGDISVDGAEGTVEVFNLSGVKVADSTENLVPGIYIVRRNGKVSKEIIR